MKILFLGSKPDEKDIWNSEILKAISQQYPLEFYDATKPLTAQFEGVGMVVDPGGSMGTPERIDAGVAAGVKLWQVTTNGLDHVDVAYFLEQGMPLANTPGPMSAIALAEHALFFMLCLAKNSSRSQKRIRLQSNDQLFNDELAGKTLGIIGLGASGRALAQRAWPLEMRLMAVDVLDISQATLDELHIEFYGAPSQLDQVLTQTDYVSLHVPLTAQTRHLIDERALALMKPTAILINVARGGLIDEAALVEALQNDRIGGAGLDVFEQEPADPTNPLLHLDDVIATPHKAGVTYATARRRAQAVVDNIACLAQGLPPRYLVTSVE